MCALCLEAASIEEKVLSMMFLTESGWTCSVCGKQSKLKSDIKRHVDSKHILDHPGYECPYCGKIVKSKEALRKHVCPCQ